MNQSFTYILETSLLIQILCQIEEKELRKYTEIR